MTNTVVSHTKTHHKTNKIIARIEDKNNLSVKIASDCPHVKNYVEKLTEVAVDNVMSFADSKVVNPKIMASLPVPCPTSIAIF